MYKFWVESLIETVRFFEGKNFTKDLEENWRRVLKPAIDLLISKY